MLNPTTWKGSALQSESTFHQLSPYIGKTKSTIAALLLEEYTNPGGLVCDPFSGCGTIVFEAWLAGRHVLANDLSPYATLLTRAKLFPYQSIVEAHEDLETMARRVSTCNSADLRTTPRWVRQFFHTETLRDILAWVNVLSKRRRWFLLACLMGILHHQRPGFLSFPSSHTVPYLRTKKFPRSNFPNLYEYRSVTERLTAKIDRAFGRVPALDFDITRHCFSKRAENLSFTNKVDAIVTSPPYMRQLDYGRDNRLRLWFLGCKDWRSLDRAVSPNEQQFFTLMDSCLRRWKRVVRQNGYCVLIMGDASREDRYNLPEQVARIAIERNGFRLVSTYADQIPNERRVRRGLAGNAADTILVLCNSGATG
jgi:DNA modification methylase